MIHHSDRGCQYLSICYTQRLVEQHISASVGNTGDAYGNALAETINGLYKAEVIRHQGPWKGVDDVEYATLEWVDWSNNRRLLAPLSHVPPTEYELAYYRRKEEAGHRGLTQVKRSPIKSGRFNLKCVIMHLLKLYGQQS